MPEAGTNKVAEKQQVKEDDSIDQMLKDMAK
jgi:hypothetical protein